jgi:hypothetical protein
MSDRKASNEEEKKKQDYERSGKANRAPKIYPVSESFKVLEGYDIYRSDELIIALVVVESDFGRDLRLYRWQKRKESWKVDLCRMSVLRWNWNAISSKVSELIDKYELLGSKGAS